MKKGIPFVPGAVVVTDDTEMMDIPDIAPVSEAGAVETVAVDTVQDFDASVSQRIES